MQELESMPKPLDEAKMKEDICKWLAAGKNKWSERFKLTDEYVKRYEAKRSISGLIGWGDDASTSPKSEPWDDCSDIGIPLEAFTIEGLLPRFLKVCYGSKPIVWVRGRGESDMDSADIVQEALNFQLLNRVKIYRNMKLVFKSVVMSGDGIAKCVWEEEFKTVNSTKYFLYDTMTGQKMTDQTGQPMVVDKDYQPIPDEFGNIPIVNKEIVSEQKKIYDGPRVYYKSIKNFIIPADADTADIQALDWVCDEYPRTLDWVKRRIGNPEEGKFLESAVSDLSSDVEARSQKEPFQFDKVLISEWHGKYDVNMDGLEEEIVLFLGKPFSDQDPQYKNAKMLGWMITPYPKRPFFHYQIIPMEGCFYGKGVPEFLVGIRNLIDAVFNQMVDRGSITNNPPVIVPPGHDNAEKPFGPGVTWKSDNPGGYTVLELPKTEQMEFTKIELLLNLVQKLFGVSDYSLGQDSGNQRTATGVLSIIGEGNVKFDDMIRALQDINEDLYEFIVELDSEFLSDAFVFRLTESPDNPFKTVGKDEWGKSFDFEAVGNSININREIEQNRAAAAYKTCMDSFQKNPCITAEVLRTVTQNFFRSIDMRNVKVPTMEEVKQIQAEMLAMALSQIQAKSTPQPSGQPQGAMNGGQQ